MRFLLIIVSLVLASCSPSPPPPPYWEDGDYRVYRRSASDEVILGYHHGDGDVFGLVDDKVVAAGSDSRYVVILRWRSGETDQYYYIKKGTSDAGTVSGPYTKANFEADAKRLSLPEFSWQLSNYGEDQSDQPAEVDE